MASTGHDATTPDNAQSDAVAAWLADARRQLERVEPEDLAAEMAAGALVVDTRDSADRAIEGALPGAVVITRNLLEWRVVPGGPNQLAGITADTRVILVCNDGCSSSTTAAGLQSLGLPRATDLSGGYRAWRAIAGA